MHINICITGWGCYLFFNFWLCIATNIMKIELYPTQYMFFIAKTNIFLKNMILFYYKLLPPMKLRSRDVAGTSLSETGVK